MSQMTVAYKMFESQHTVRLIISFYRLSYRKNLQYFRVESQIHKATYAQEWATGHKLLLNLKR